MKKELMRSSLMLSLELERNVDEDGDTGDPVIKASLSLDKHFWVNSGRGATTEMVWNHVNVLDSGLFVIVTNDDDVTDAEIYEDMAFELEDRLVTQLRRLLRASLDL